MSGSTRKCFLFENALFYSVVNDGLLEYRIPGWWLFSLKAVKDYSAVFWYLLRIKLNLIVISLQVICLFSLIAFKIFCYLQCSAVLLWNVSWFDSLLCILFGIWCTLLHEWTCKRYSLHSEKFSSSVSLAVDYDKFSSFLF